MAEKIYFKIGDVAKKFGVAPSLIRYWEQEFSFIRTKKTAGGTRLYSKREIDRLGIVFHLVKEKGMTIQGAKEYLKKKKHDKTLDHLQVINTLKRTRQLLADVKSILENRNPAGGKTTA